MKILLTGLRRFFNVAGAYQQYGERHDPETHITPLALAAAAGTKPEFLLYALTIRRPMVLAYAMWLIWREP